MRAPDLFPQHPGLGEAARIRNETRERLIERDLWDAADEFDYERDLWDAEEEVDYERDTPTRPSDEELLHRHAYCAHLCSSLACLVTAGRKDWLCESCQLSQSDSRSSRYRPLVK
jgi:hypothetical protein